jgi:hypothetical protein
MPPVSVLHGGSRAQYTRSRATRHGPCTAITLGAIREELPEAYHFSLPRPPCAELKAAEALRPGLRQTLVQCHFDVNGARPAYRDGRIRHTSVAARLEAGLIRRQATLAEGVAPSIGAAVEAMARECVARRLQAELRLSGFVRVGRPGVHRLYFRPHPDGELSLGGQHCVRGRCDRKRAA